MGVKRGQGLPARLEAVRRRFERWRGTHKARSRIPEPLWKCAVKMVSLYGLHRTAKALGLDYYSLQKWVELSTAAGRGLPSARRRPNRAPADAGRTGLKATFLELVPPTAHGFGALPTGTCDCTLELEDTGGRKMRIYLTGVGMSDLASLTRSMWDRRS